MNDTAAEDTIINRVKDVIDKSGFFFAPHTRKTEEQLPNENFDKGNNFLNEGKFKEAVGCYYYALRDDSKNANALNNMGRAYAGLENFDQALECFNLTLSLNPEFLMALSNKGNVYCALEHFDEAIECYKAALKVDPRYIQALSNLATAYASSSRLSEALDCCDKAIQQNPEFKDAHYNKGDIYIATEQYKQAVECFSTATKIDPKCFDSFNRMGNALYKLSRFQEAAESFQKAIDINPMYAFSYGGLGNVQYALSEYNAAIESYNSAIQLDKSGFEYHYNKIFSLFMAKRNDEVPKCLKLMQDDVPNSSMVGGFGHVINADQRFVLKLVPRPRDQLPHEEDIGNLVKGENLIEYVHFATYTVDGDDKQDWVIIQMIKASTTLRKLIKQDNLTYEMIYPIIVGLLHGLHQFHEQKLIHCDIKESNIGIMLPCQSPADIKILDFGAATYFEENIHAMTSQYACPEIYQRDACPMFDTFSVGVVLQNCLGAVFEASASQDMHPLQKVVERACLVPPNERYLSALAMLEEFTRYWKENETNPHFGFKQLQLLTYASINQRVASLSTTVT
jgi:tetratricopeptide (TPR) repeat protein